MRAEKAARIQSYLVRNSARVSMKKREPEETRDYYEKNKYLNELMSEKDVRKKEIMPGVDSTGAQRYGKRSGRAGRRIFGRISAWSLVSFVLVIFILFFALKLAG